MEPIELAFPSPDGIIDCRLEPMQDEAGPYYGATILYPHTVNGFGRSEIYCHNMRHDAVRRAYCFETNDVDIHPKILELEKQVSDEIMQSQAK